MDRSPTANLPSSWITQDPTLRHYDGLVWYQRKLSPPRTAPGSAPSSASAPSSTAPGLPQRPRARAPRGRLHAASPSRSPACSATATMSSPSAPIPPHTPDTVPPPVTDWETYGGITRPVTLVYTPATYVDDAWVRLTRDGRIAVTLRLDGEAAANQQVQLRIPELGFTIAGRTDADGSWSGAAAAPPGLERWSPESPRLYDVRFETRCRRPPRPDRLPHRSRSAARTSSSNGRPIFLRGISLHEEEIGAEPTRAITPGRRPRPARRGEGRPPRQFRPPRPLSPFRGDDPHGRRARPARLERDPGLLADQLEPGRDAGGGPPHARREHHARSQPRLDHPVERRQRDPGERAPHRLPRRARRRHPRASTTAASSPPPCSTAASRPRAASRW